MTLGYVLATKELFVRPTPHWLPFVRPLDLAQLSFSSLEELTQHAVNSLRTDTVGVSHFNLPSGSELTWVAVAGAMNEFEGRRFPLRHSMCGVCYETGAPQLFVHPERFFKWMAWNDIGAIEALVVPVWGENSTFLGTIWAMRQKNSSAPFNRLHVEILELYALNVADLFRSGDLKAGE